MAQGLSVIICCYNSASRIANTLKHIALQRVKEDFLWEVILVNNNSTDNTVERAMEEWQTYTAIKASFKIVTEIQAGLSFARSKGVNEANYDILVFCDDDNWLAENYIQETYNIFKDNDTIGITGGFSTAFCQEIPPYWFDRYSIHFAVGGKKKSSYVNTVTGAGLGIRKYIYAQLVAADFKPQLSDRKGNMLSSGGDDELCIAARFLGYRIYYSTNLQFTHYMPASRLNWEYFSRLYTTGFAWSGIIMELYYFVFTNQCNINTGDSKVAYAYLKQKVHTSLLSRIKAPLQLLRFIKALFIITEGNDYALKSKYAFNRYVLVLKNKKALLHIYNNIVSFSQNASTLSQYDKSCILNNATPYT